MAQRRMFSPSVIDTDKFLEMSTGSQNLYFHLGMRADDDGFVASPKKIMSICNATTDDMRVLVSKGYIIPFESGVVVITSWRINNLIRKDWYRETKYKEEKAQLTEEDGKYILLVNESLTNRQRRLGKVRLGKDNTYMSPQTPQRGDDGFDTFWESYPKKENKKKALDIWKRKKLGRSLTEILSFVESAKETDRWQKGYVMHPTTFLNGERWNDELGSYGSEQTGGWVDLSSVNIEE